MPGEEHSSNTNDLVSDALAEVAGGAVGQEKGPRVGSAGGHRRTRPKIGIHIRLSDPVGAGCRANAVGVGFHDFFLGR